MSRRQRLDAELVRRRLVLSRTEAARAIEAGLILVNGSLADKPARLVDPADAVVVQSPPSRFVSRGGDKLDAALDRFGIDVAGKRVLDAGASTGGFTDCLLRRGASRVIALDVGYGQLDWKLRNDPRVEVMERLNARHLQPDRLPYRPDLATVDVSFISLTKVVPAVAASLAQQGQILALVKPQFELGRGRVRGGVVRSAEERREALLVVAHAARETGLSVRGFASSGLPGPKGNRETFIWCAAEGDSVEDLEVAVREVEA
jgi:23S rRNA (cytidine1920-2'-O)/16S rRNA (cytidine1409-2'-O)-methyltransferase